MQIVILLLVGLIIGAIARFVKPGSQPIGWVATMGIGVLGSLGGGFLSQFFGDNSILDPGLIGYVLAVVIAVVLLGVYMSLTNRR